MRRVASSGGRPSLRTLVGLSIALAQILAVAVLSVPVLDGRDTIIYEQARQMARARARLGAALLEQELARLTPREIEAALSAFLTSPDVLEARIVRSGAVLGRVSAPVAAASLAADRPELRAVRSRSASPTPADRSTRACARTSSSCFAVSGRTPAGPG